MTQADSGSRNVAYNRQLKFVVNEHLKHLNEVLLLQCGVALVSREDVVDIGHKSDFVLLCLEKLVLVLLEETEPSGARHRLPRFEDLNIALFVKLHTDAFQFIHGDITIDARSTKHHENLKLFFRKILFHRRQFLRYLRQK